MTVIVRVAARLASPLLAVAGILETLELAGALAIIACETLGLILKGSFSANWLPLAPAQTIRSGGILQVFSGSELIEVGTGLVLVIFSILGMAHDWTPDNDDHDEQPDVPTGDRPDVRQRSRP